MSGDWSSVPTRGGGLPVDPRDGQEARHDAAASAPAPAHGRVHGRPAPQYGEYAPEGWVNPVLVEQERLEQRERSGSTRVQAAEEAVRGRRPGHGSPEEPSGAASPTPTTGRFGASPLDFVITVALLVVGLTSTIQTLQVGETASSVRRMLEAQGVTIADPAALSSATVVVAFVDLVLFVAVVWWSVVRLRARRWTFWVPLAGGLLATVFGAVVVFAAATSS